MRYNPAMIDIVIVVLLLAILLLVGWLVPQVHALTAAQKSLAPQLEEKHRAMLLDLHDGLNKLGDRLNAGSGESSERLRSAVAQELKATRDAMQALQLSQGESLAATREQVLEKLHQTLAEQGKAEQELIQPPCVMQRCS